MKPESMSDKKDRKLYTGETTLFPLSIKSQGFVYVDLFKKIEKITAEFDGFSKEYYVSDYGEMAAVLVIRDNYVLLTRQYRLLINRLSYEVPGGNVNDGEGSKEAAVRECLEETGVKCTNLKPLIAYDPDLEYTRNHTHVFYSEEIESDSLTEKKSHEWVPFNECLKMIERAVITDSLSIITIMAYQLRIGEYK